MNNKRENGEVVVEASIIVTLVALFITIMIYIGMILYQQTLVSVMANQTAANIAQVYSNNLRDPFTGYVDPDRVYQSITYSNMKTDAYVDVIEQKAGVFAKYRLKSSDILASKNTSVEVELVKKPNELLKSQIVVTVRDKFDMPLVTLFGVDGLVEFASSGRADCVDILEYLNGVEAVGDPEESNVSFLPDSDNCTVTFIPDRSSPTEFSIVTVLKGKSILSSNRYTHCVMPANPVKDSYEFDGWVTESNNVFSSSTVINSNMIVYGAWKCNVTLDADGGKVNSVSKYTFTVKAGAKTNFLNATRDGYNFKGWFTQKNGGGTKYLSNDTPINSDITLYAAWECTHTGDTGYKWKSRHGYMCVDNPYDLYICQRCGAQKKVSVEGEHNNKGRCNDLHDYGKDFHCTTGGGTWHRPGYGKYHVTCTGCGRVATSTGAIIFDGKKHDYWFWCGKHGIGATETNTH